MPSPHSDRNLLFGILAVQLDFINRDQLVAAMHDWLLAKPKSLSGILVDKNVLGAERAALVDALVIEHLKQHNDDPHQSLAALSSLGSSLAAELQRLGDPEIQASLAVVGASWSEKSTMQVTRSTGDSTSSGSRFTILRPHAKGGLGEVFVAMDQELNREVALKEIQSRYLHDEDNRARFVLEAEITGGLEHPGIVPVYGLGHFGDGRPYYAMRFVKGDSLKEAIRRFHENDRPDTDPSERMIEFRKLLGRFVDVCNAVEYAHSRGVLHRDLKPGNIMLGKYGETLVVDWGLAKAVGRSDAASDTDEPTLRPASGSGSAPTQLGSALGTPHFMSPEQAAGRIDQLGPASDVYSLGATLYCLITGQTPFAESDIGVVLERVKAGDFPRPTALKPEAPRALESICLKAMSLNLSDRYQSPQLLADDVERYLADEPVMAHSEPVLVKGRRWIRKHPKSVAAIAATVLVSLASLIAIAAVVTNKNRLLYLANAELKKANDQVRDAEQLARNEASIATAINTFLRVDLLGQASPEQEPNRNITLREILDRAADKLAGRFESQPLVEAEIAQTIGNTYRHLGELTLAENHLVRARDLFLEQLGIEHHDSAIAVNDLADLYYLQGRYDDAEPLYRLALEICRDVLGEENSDTLTAMNDLANIHADRGEYDEAAQIYERILEISRRVLGENDVKLQVYMSNLAYLYHSQGRFDEAEPYFEELLENLRQSIGNEKPKTLIAMNNLGFFYKSQGRWDEAEPLFLESLAIHRRVMTNEHPNTLKALNNLAELYLLQNRADEAESLLRESTSIQMKKSPDDWLLYNTKSMLGGALAAQQKFEQAEPFLIEGYEGLKKRTDSIPAPHRKRIVEALERLVALYQASKNQDEAARWGAELEKHQSDFRTNANQNED